MRHSSDSFERFRFVLISKLYYRRTFTFVDIPFPTLGSDTYPSPGSQFFRKILITQRNLNQTLKYYNPLVSGPVRLE